MTWKNAPINFGFKVLEDADDFSKKVAGEMLQRVVVETPIDYFFDCECSPSYKDGVYSHNSFDKRELLESDEVDGAC